MKTEYEIAKENVIPLRAYDYYVERQVCKEHLSTLRRWLDYLCCLYAKTDNQFIIAGKVKDIKQAIKLYEDALGGKDENN